MTWLRAALRRLDPWAALLLGGLLAMGVVILLATPGPWQRVVGKETPVRLEAPSPDDVALFVMSGRGGSCSGVVWMHVDSARRSMAAVVVPPSLSGFSPTDGFAPVVAIADSAGPSAAAAALGGALGVSMDAWVALDRKAADLAIQGMVPATDVRAARTRYRAARAAWRGRGGERGAWVSQYETLNISLPQVAFRDLGVVAFSNYVLGFGFVRSDLTLQGATSLGEALRDVDPSRVDVRAAPAIVERCRGGEVWRADASKVEPLRQSLAIGIRPPDEARLVTVRGRAARVLVVAPFGRTMAQYYAAQVRRRLDESAGAPVQVTLVWGSDERLAYRAAQELDRRPALAVLVGPPAPVAGPAVARVYAMLRNRRQEAVASGPLAKGSGPSPAVSPGVAATADATAEVDVAASRLPVSWPPEPPSGASRQRSLALVAAARANVETLVRACWPGALAPDLASTALRFAFVEARHAGVGVVSSSDAAAASLLSRLRLWGFPAVRVTLEDGGWQPPRPGALVCYRPGSREAAAALAGDLGLPARSVVKTGDSPKNLVVVTAD